MAKESRKSVLPIWGYLVLNAVFLAVMAGVWFYTDAYARQNRFFSAGIFPVLMICWLAFTVVSIFDAVFDRSAARSAERRSPADAGAPAAPERRKEQEAPSRR